MRKLAFLLVAFAGACLHDSPPGSHIAWHNTAAYQEAVAALPISPGDARQSLIAAVSDRATAYFDPDPIFVSGTEYFFGIPVKTGPQPLTGFYVDGVTGVIEHRQSHRSSEYKTGLLPPEAFFAVDRIE